MSDKPIKDVKEQKNKKSEKLATKITVKKGSKNTTWPS